jgi:hypothetical protein
MVFMVILSAPEICLREVHNLAGRGGSAPSTARRCRAGIGEENRAAYTADLSVRFNLMVWNAAVYCAQVEPATLMVSLRCTLI